MYFNMSFNFKIRQIILFIYFYFWLLLQGHIMRWEFLGQNVKVKVGHVATGWDDYSASLVNIKRSTPT